MILKLMALLGDTFYNAFNDMNTNLYTLKEDFKMKKFRCVIALCGQETEAFVKNLLMTNGVDLVQITRDKRHAVVEMTDEVAEAADGILFQVA